MNKQSRELGMLLGLHVGDSLGANLEFKEPSSEEYLQTEIVGGGDLNWRAGEATDDTQMMIKLLESISRNHGKIDLNDIADNYLEWYKTNPKDIGGTVRRSLNNLSRGVPINKSGQRDHYSQGNGSLMRCAPLSLVPATQKEIFDQCAITHSHKNCLDCDFIFISILKDILNNCAKDQLYDNALKKSEEINQEIFSSLKRITILSWSDVCTDGFVIDTLAFSFWALLNYDSFEESLIRIINRGGDADTLGAVTGALCGAYYGMDSIPERWLKIIEERNKVINLSRKIIFE